MTSLLCSNSRVTDRMGARFPCQDAPSSPCDPADRGCSGVFGCKYRCKFIKWIFIDKNRFRKKKKKQKNGCFLSLLHGRNSNVGLWKHDSNFCWGLPAEILLVFCFIQLATPVLPLQDTLRSHEEVCLCTTIIQLVDWQSSTAFPSSARLHRIYIFPFFFF